MDFSDKKSPTSTQQLLVTPVEGISPLGFGPKYLDPTRKPYLISRGKTRGFRVGILYLFLSIALLLIGKNLFPYTDNSTLAGWLPRILSFSLVILSILRFRESVIIEPFLVFDEDGIKHEGSIYVWNNITEARIVQSRNGKSRFDLVFEYESKTIIIDIKNVDEFSEDVGHNLAKYLKKFKREDITNKNQ